MYEPTDYLLSMNVSVEMKDPTENVNSVRQEILGTNSIIYCSVLFFKEIEKYIFYSRPNTDKLSELLGTEDEVILKAMCSFL